MSLEGDYSGVADAQLDTLESGPDVDLHNSVLDTIEFHISGRPARPSHFPQRSPLPTAFVCDCRSSAIRPTKCSDGARIEAVFPHP